MQIDAEERQKGRNFVKRIKERWDYEFSDKKRTVQNLVDNAKPFAKEGWREEEQIVTHTTVEKKKTEWNTEMQIKLLIIDEEERAKGQRFMKRIKERWDTDYPKYATASIQKLKDNAADDSRRNQR